MKLFVIFLAILPLSLGDKYGFSLSCKDEKHLDVDWFINYKLPKNEHSEGELKGTNGKEYAYLVSGYPAGTWMLSDIPITAENSMLGLTMQDFYGNLPTTKDFTYIFYNDELPKGMPEIASDEVGHTKGVVIFGLDQGFWLIHSIPKFPPKNRYEYPENALDYGQSILCLTFGIDSLNSIGKQLLMNHPHIYSHHLSPHLKVHLDHDVKSLFSKHPKFIKGQPTQRQVKLLTKKENFTIYSFAKNAEFEKDLYSGLIAPSLGASLFTETWRREPGVLPPECHSKYKVLDVKAIAMNVEKGSEKHSFDFQSHFDHSKWAITQEFSFVCIGDINRMKSQEKRGGGSACLGFPEVWKLFKGIINKTDTCPMVDVNHEL